MSIELAAQLVVVSHPEGVGHFFANTKRDDGPSVLCLSHMAQVPVYQKTENGPTFAGHDYFIFNLPQVSDKIVANVGPGSSERKKNAVAWTTAGLWRCASTQYAVMHDTLAGTAELWRGYGVLEMSYLFPTRTWEGNGIFWRSRDGLSTMRIVTVPPGGMTPYSKGPNNDPRLPLSSLVRKHQDLRHELLLTA